MLFACILAAQTSPAATAPPLRAPQTKAPGPPASLAALIARCQRGDPGGAAAEFATWDARRVAVEASVPAGTDDVTLATLVVLHTGAAILQGAFGGTNIQPRTDSPHYPAARQLVGILANRAKARPKLRAFSSNWYVLASSLWCAGRRYVDAERALRAGHGPLGDDPDFLLAVATANEALMGPYPTPGDATLAYRAAGSSTRFNASDMKQTSLGLVTPDCADAESRLRKALALNPGLVEARLRLGHVYSVLNRYSDARAEFERVLADAPRANHPFAACLAALFLGELHEQAGRNDDAKKAYELAIELEPADQAAHLALGRLLVATGRADEGWAVVRRMLGGPGGAPRAAAESIEQYRSGQYWQAPSRIAALEAWVQR
jgi:tetratricopeptide (TPR) repeat protein